MKNLNRKIIFQLIYFLVLVSEFKYANFEFSNRNYLYKKALRRHLLDDRGKRRMPFYYPKQNYRQKERIFNNNRLGISRLCTCRCQLGECVATKLLDPTVYPPVKFRKLTEKEKWFNSEGSFDRPKTRVRNEVTRNKSLQITTQKAKTRRTTNKPVEKSEKSSTTNLLSSSIPKNIKNNVIRNFTVFSPFNEDVKVPFPFLKITTTCDSYEDSRRICWITKQLGDIVTLSVDVGGVYEQTNSRFDIIWEKRIRVFGSGKDITRRIIEDDKPENIFISSNGLQIKIKPILDTDFDFNSFSAVIKESTGVQFEEVFTVIGKVTFNIDIRPFDMGEVYQGEITTIDISHYLSIPNHGISFGWGIEKENLHDIIPLTNNMKLEKSGRSITIRHFKDDQSQIVVCVAYTTSKLFFAKRRFIIHEPRNSINSYNL